jgi:hypothetical protein
MEIAITTGKYRMCDCDGVIMHLNPAYGHLEKDAMFIEQQDIGWSIDRETYERRKSMNYGL